MPEAIVKQSRNAFPLQWRKMLCKDEDTQEHLYKKSVCGVGWGGA